MPMRIWPIWLEVWWIAVIFLARESCSLKGLRIIVPEVVESGATVTLSCEYDLEKVALYSINWYWNGHEFYRFVPKESPPYRDFSVAYFNIDLFRSGPTQVTLRGVRQEQSGRYECEVSCDAPLFHTDHASATMLVAELSSDNPEMSVQPGRVEVGSRLKAKCSAPGTNPPANLTWFINEEQILEDNESVKIYPAQLQTDTALGLHSAKMKIEIIINRSHFVNGIMLLKCEANVFTLWNRSVETPVAEYVSQQIIPALGSVSSQQSQLNHQVEDIGNNASCNDFQNFFHIIFVIILFDKCCRR